MMKDILPGNSRLANARCGAHTIKRLSGNGATGILSEKSANYQYPRIARIEGYKNPNVTPRNGSNRGQNARNKGTAQLERLYAPIQSTKERFR